jgi:hypothetical protein
VTTRAPSALGPLEALARRAVTQPIGAPVPSDDEHFFAKKGVLKLASRMLRRRAELAASGQKPLLVGRIDPAWQRAIWFHAEAPQIGDALMDLAPRSLLAERGIVVDLVAPPATAALFLGDRWLGRVGDDEGAIDVARYDFAIADSNGWKALAAKRVHAARLPWVSIHGDYLAYDYQRGLFATRRLAALLGTTLDDAAERTHARQKLAIGDEPLPRREAPARIAIALGGVRAERSYHHWPAVARGLAQRGWTRFAQHGSGNAKAAASEVRTALAGADVLDLVARTDLHGAQRAMAACAIVVCADGGLLHLACTTTTPLLGLFDSSVDPSWRLPVESAGAALRAPVRDVSAIGADAVIAKALEILVS